jgi:hypothetical protein
MEHDGLLPCSEDPATGSHPEPVKSNHNLKFYFPNMLFNIILPSAAIWWLL